MKKTEGELKQMLETWFIEYYNDGEFESYVTVNNVYMELFEEDLFDKFDKN